MIGSQPEPSFPHLRRGLFSAMILAMIAMTPAETYGNLPAFPGAEGFGKYATGGRGGSVYYVTNLNNSGPGSFRDAVSQSNRTVVFAVSGVIDYQAPRYNVASNVTIAGQTAPGDGVVLYGDGIGFSNAHNNITRFMRFRMGVGGTNDRDAVAIARGNDMIFDHVSISWGRDENFSINPDSGHEINRITIQNAIIAQGLLGHSAGGLIQTQGGVSILGSLYHSNSTRNPRARFVTEFVNNVVYNWGVAGYILGDSSGTSHGNVFGNYFINGPGGSGSAFTRGNTNYNLFAQDNWHDSNRNGALDGSLLSQSAYGTVTWRTNPFPYPVAVEDALPARTALKSVISKVGASLRRDEVDELLLHELESWGTLGQFIGNEFEGDLNGPGHFRSLPPYTDTSLDGMPDFWKLGTGQNVNTQNHNDPSPSGSGYTRLEDYLNWLAEPHGIAPTDTPVHVDLRQYTRGFVPFGPVYSVNNAQGGTVEIVDGHIARFVPDPAFEGPGGFEFAVVDDDGDTMTRPMNLFFTPLAQTGHLIWKGEENANLWDTGEAANWFDGRSLRFPFSAGDHVTLDYAGINGPVVNLSGSLEPASVHVTAEHDYVFEGDGSLDGSMVLDKEGNGTLTINTVNSFTGATTVGQGSLLVHGELTQSPVIVHADAATGGGGNLGAGLTLDPGAALIPGDGIGDPGVLTIGSALNAAGDAVFHFDLSNDPTGEQKTNDRIDVIGDLNLGGMNTIEVNLLDGPPGDGAYTLFTYTGSFSGSLDNLQVAGAHGTLSNPSGAIELIVSSERPATDLVWAGDSGANLWDTGETPNWRNQGVPDYFYFLDSVLFDNTGSAGNVSLVGDLTPMSVLVDADGDYTFTGSGRITGTTGITKRGDGTLTITTTNNYTGATAIEGGILSVSSLANADEPSPIGAADAAPENLIVSNGTLRLTSASGATDRGITLAGTGTLSPVTPHANGHSLHGPLNGSGTLVKTGGGTITLTAENEFSGGTIIREGTLALFGPSGGAATTANNYALGSGSVTFEGGTLRLFGGGMGDAGPGYGTFSRPIIVPAGETGTILTPARYSMSSSLTGSGTLNLEVNFVRGRMSGNWSQFSGLINVTARQDNSEFRIANTNGYGNAALFLNDGVIVTRQGSSTTIDIGSLGGTSGSVIGPGNQTSSGSHYRIGGRNEDATFNGRILSDGTNTVTKIGTGNQTFTGANTYSGGTIINAGTLTVNNTSGSGTGSGSVAVNNNGTLAGTGTISGQVTVASGGTIAPGADSLGTLRVNNNVTLQAGSTTRVRIHSGSGASDQLSVQNTLNLGGALNVVHAGGVFSSGNSFQVISAGNINGGFSSFSLPTLPDGLEWDTSEISTTGHIHVTGVQDPPSLPLEYAFGSADERDSDDAFVKSGYLPDTWNLDSHSFDFRRNPGSTIPGFAEAAATTNTLGAINGTDFALRAQFIASGLESRPLEFLGDGNSNGSGYVETGITAGDLGIDGGNPRTIEAWALARTFDNNGTVWAMGNTGANRRDWTLKVAGNSEEWVLNHWGSGGNDIWFDIPGSTNQWVHLAMVFTGTHSVVYVNGQEVARADRSDLDTGNNNTFKIGWWHNRPNGPNLNGFVEDVRVWNVVRTEEEIRENRFRRLNGSEPGLAAYWPMDEGEGTTVFDLGPNGFHGTIVTFNHSAPRWTESGGSRIGLTFLGDDANADNAYRFFWHPFANQLSLHGPGNDSLLDTVDFTGAANAPQYVKGASYTLDLKGTYDPETTLNLTGTLSDNNGGRAEISTQVEVSGGIPSGDFFGFIGRHPDIAWQGFIIGAPEHLEPDPEGMTFALWIEGQFGSETDPAIVGPNATPAGDGITNFLKYALGYPATTRVSAADLPRPEMVDGILRLTYRERRGGDVTYRPEMSTGLQPEGWDTEGVEEINRTPLDDEFDEVTVQAIPPAGSHRAFLRLTVSQTQ